MMWALLASLCAQPGVSGREDEVRDLILEQLHGHCAYTVDALGNVIVHKEGRQRGHKKLMISAHMDEVGLIITFIEDTGLLRFATVGGVDTRILPGKRVLLGKDRLPGVVCTKAIHQMAAEEKDAPPKLEDLVIDIGATSQEGAQEVVRLGETGVMCGELISFGDEHLCGKALDDRLGCWMLVQLLRQELPYDLHASFTVQEEVGCIGGKTAAAAILPDIAIALETTTACDIPDTPDHQVVCALGKGPVLSFMDRGTVYDYPLYRKAQALAESRGIPCQSKAGVYGGNEARMLQTAGTGAAVLALSVPARYLHTPSTVVAKTDIDAAQRLLQALAETLPAQE